MSLFAKQLKRQPIFHLVYDDLLVVGNLILIKKINLKQKTQLYLIRSLLDKSAQQARRTKLVSRQILFLYIVLLILLSVNIELVHQEIGAMITKAIWMCYLRAVSYAYCLMLKLVLSGVLDLIKC
ncbi:hypothetical protein BpHYR1_047966 [Brachionus plicatilis]|uniref:Uncharacterized protein n=1 Tax=Brachionus plicatilis TaxID=10195 RepID=A0A3M7T9R8_BRAPC|nr:hypothetical protein BpHYR1_047966 [Brachionus plicatilis]